MDIKEIVIKCILLFLMVMGFIIPDKLKNKTIVQLSKVFNI